MEEKNKSGIFSQSNLLLIMIVIMIGASFALGMMWGKIQVYESGGISKAIDPETLPQAVQEPTSGIASIDDDPMIGDENAPITMIEFSDYECPFCKRYFDETFSQIVEKYVDTGKVKIVFRDLPLSFHDPMATKEAIAANCSREQGGDKKYFEYHDEIFTRTISNGNGLSEKDLITIAQNLGLNLSSFNTCIEDPDQEAEVKNDLADAGKAGASGTPTFVIGKSTDDGVIDGKLVVGAQPLSAFEAIFNTLE